MPYFKDGTQHHCPGPKIPKLKGNCTGEDHYGYCTEHKTRCRQCGWVHLKIERCMKCGQVRDVSLSIFMIHRNLRLTMPTEEGRCGGGGEAQSCRRIRSKIAKRQTTRTEEVKGKRLVVACDFRSASPVLVVCSGVSSCFDGAW